MRVESEVLMKRHMTMQDLPEEERPCERCLAMGPEVLTDAELLAVVLRSGTRELTALELAREVLKACPYEPGITGILHMSMMELMHIRGIGKVRAVQLACIGELSRRITRTQSRKKLSFREPATIAEYYMEHLRHREQEHICCMMLDTRGKLLGEKELSRGTVNTSLLSPRELFLTALSYHAVKIVLVHNHPSGNTGPSGEDLRITRQIAEAGALLDIGLLDHIIIGDREFLSLRQAMPALFSEMPAQKDIGT